MGVMPMNITIDGYSQDEIFYHVRLLYEAELLNVTGSLSGPSIHKATPMRLTWEAHEFLDSARSDNLWTRAKEEMKSLGNFSFQVLKEILVRIALNSSS